MWRKKVLVLAGGNSTGARQTPSNSHRVDVIHVTSLWKKFSCYLVLYALSVHVTPFSLHSRYLNEPAGLLTGLLCRYLLIFPLRLAVMGTASYFPVGLSRNQGDWRHGLPSYLKVSCRCVHVHKASRADALHGGVWGLINISPSWNAFAKLMGVTSWSLWHWSYGVFDETGKINRDKWYAYCCLLEGFARRALRSLSWTFTHSQFATA